MIKPAGQMLGVKEVCPVPSEALPQSGPCLCLMAPRLREVPTLLALSSPQEQGGLSHCDPGQAPLSGPQFPRL